MTRGLRRMIRHAGLVLAATAALAACNAPFIPVPPPDNVFVSESLTDGAGTTKTVWITQGKADPRAALAKFYIFNDSIGSGVIVDANADGTYTAPAMDGTQGDHVFISYTTPNGSDSEVACRQLIEGDPAPACPR
jgi:hypothetical protein